MAIQVKCKIDTSKLNAAITERLKYADRTAAEAVNTAAYYIVKKTKDQTPFVEQETIDTELGVGVFLINKRGGGFYRSKKKQVYSASRTIPISTGTGQEREVPLAVAIIQSRTQPGKGGRWHLDKSPFATGKGGLAAGRAAMVAAVSRMIAARHSSTHLLQVAWASMLGTLKKFAKTGSGYASNSISRARWSENDFGYAIPARDNGSGKVTCLLVNNTGVESEHVDGGSMNRAMWEYSAPVFQRAIDEETSATYRIIEEKLKPLDERFNRMAS